MIGPFGLSPMTHMRRLGAAVSTCVMRSRRRVPIRVMRLARRGQVSVAVVVGAMSGVTALIWHYVI
jgi:hypothetical protein